MLSEGRTLSEVTEVLFQAHGVNHRVAPVTDGMVCTQVRTDDGTLDFQDYFVRRKAEPRVREITYSGAEEAHLSPAANACLGDPGLQAIVFAPSNPWLSIAPMLAVQGVRETMGRLHLPIIAISPIIAGQAVKGPAAKLLGELGFEVSAFGVAQYYQGLITDFVIDTRDAGLERRIADIGIRVHCTDILVPTLTEQKRLAQYLLDLLRLPLH